MTRLLKLAQRWNASIDAWLMAPERNAAGRLGLFRIVYGAFYLWYLSQSKAVILSGLPPGHRNRILVLDLLFLSPDLPPPFFSTLESLLVTSLVILTLGYRVRLMTLAVLALGCVLEGLQASLDNEHASSFLVFYIPFFVLLAGGRWGHTYSIDAMLARRAGAAEVAPTNPDGGFMLQTRAVLVVLSLLFLSSAFHKLGPDATWLGNPELLTHLMLEKNVIATLLGLPLNPLAPLFAELPGLGAAMRYGVILFEGLFVLVLVDRRIRDFIFAQALLFHAVNALWLTVTFTPLLIVYGLFVDWQALRERLCPGPLTRVDALPSWVLVAAAVGAAIAAGACWNLGDGVRAAANLGGMLDWRTVWYPILPLALAWWLRSLSRLVRWPASTAS